MASAASRLARQFGGGVRRLAVVHLWRRSLYFRVVGITLALGVAMLALVGSYLYQSIATGLVDDRTRVSTAEALQLTRDVQRQFDVTDKVQTPEALKVAAVTFVQNVAGTEWSRYVVLTRLSTTRNSVVVPPVLSGEVNDGAIPPELAIAVAQDARRQHVQLTSLRLVGEPEPVPSVVVGQQVTLPLAGGYGLYFFYPMKQERDSLTVVARTLLYGGALLALLIAAVAFVVTRLVVTPVRQAAGVAQRLAAGRLDERMRVRGADDLASLARSFNAMAEGLQRQIGQLEGLSRVQQRFVSDVSHELRTPLTTIRMAVDLIHANRGDFTSSVARSAELLQDQLNRFEALLADLLEISRFDAGAAVLDPESADLRRTVTKVVDDVQPLATSRGSRITVIDPGEGCVAAYDPRRVERILRNLVVNAIEHGEGRPIEIHLGVNAAAVAVAVRDHGVGLRPGEAGLVFNRFWRADPARARTTGGTGLGLSIAVEDARLHAGWLQAWGAPGQGSCFRLTLPRTPGAPIDSSPVPLTPAVARATESPLESAVRDAVSAAPGGSPADRAPRAVSSGTTRPEPEARR